MPPNGTAGLARSAVSGISRLPSPPARTMARTFGVAASSFGHESALSCASSRSAATPVPATSGDARARRPADQGVPAGGLRRRRRPRRRARPGAARPRRHRRAGALLRRSPRRGGHDRVRRPAASWRRPTPALQTLGVDLPMAADCAGADLVHSHTWYANIAGHLAGRCCTASRTSSPRTASSRCGRGRPSSSAAATRVSSLGRADRVRGARPASSRSATACAPTSCASYPHVDPARVHVVHNGIDPERWSPRRGPGRRAPPRHRPRPALGRLRRPDHPAEGPALLPARRRPSCRRTCSWCSAPVRPTPRRSWPRSRRWSPTCGRPATGVVWIDRDAAARRGRRAALAPAPSSPAPRSTSRSASSTSRRWPASWPSWRRRPAASPRSSSTARPAGSCRSSRCRTAPARRSTRIAFVADLAAALTEAVSDPDRARACGRAGRAARSGALPWGSIGDRTLEVYRRSLAGLSGRGRGRDRRRCGRDRRPPGQASWRPGRIPAMLSAPTVAAVATAPVRARQQRREQHAGGARRLALVAAPASRAAARASVPRLTTEAVDMTRRARGGSPLGQPATPPR